MLLVFCNGGRLSCVRGCYVGSLSLPCSTRPQHHREHIRDACSRMLVQRCLQLLKASAQAMRFLGFTSICLARDPLSSDIRTDATARAFNFRAQASKDTTFYSCCDRVFDLTVAVYVGFAEASVVHAPMLVGIRRYVQGGGRRVCVFMMWPTAQCLTQSPAFAKSGCFQCILCRV